MLAQYKNINRLLGPTDEWTHPGDFCEILFREFLRRFLPPNLSADKGFFYGRATLEGEDTHCPEIDILIHDTQQYRPIFRMGDFVIVQSTRPFLGWMIQVKRTFSQGQVKKGLKNVLCAKQHLLNVLWKDNPRGWGNWGLPPRVFTAIVGFKDEIGRNINFYRKQLIAWSVKHRAYDRPSMERTSMYVLPGFIGSLSGSFVMLDGPCNYWNQRYFVLESQHDKANICIQAFLAKIYNVLGGEPGEMPPFSFPHDLKPFGDFHVLRITKVVRNPDDSRSKYSVSPFSIAAIASASVSGSTPKRVEPFQLLVDLLVLVDQMAVVQEDHLVVLVAEQDSKVLDLVGVVSEEGGSKAVPQPVQAQPVRPVQPLRLLEFVPDWYR